MAEKLSGFTLIELLIVVAIIGILAAIAVPAFQGALLRAKVARAIVDEKLIKDAYIQWGMEHGQMPQHSDMITAHDGLTTPIAFLPHRMFDRFAEGLPRHPHSFLYHAEPRTEVPNYKSVSYLRGGFTSGHSFILLGYGPAKMRSLVPYSPSNGILSQGGILTWIPMQHEDDGGFVPINRR